jgi:Skp family chaperone for outer membrane proteins
MKKVIFSMLVLSAVMFAGEDVKAQQFKVAVFDIDYMVQAMPGYASVDSLLQIYQQDSLATEYNIYQSEYQRLDSTFKADSATGKSKAILDYTAGKRQEMAMNLVYWQQIAQRKSETKRGQLAQPLYVQVAGAYQKVLEIKKYNLILKPQTYEFGIPYR